MESQLSMFDPGMEATHKHTNPHLSSRQIRRRGKFPALLLPEPGCAAWLSDLAVTASTKGERDRLCCPVTESAAVQVWGAPSRRSKISSVPYVQQWLPGQGSLCLPQQKLTCKRILEAISEQKLYSLNISFLLSLGETHLSELKGNISYGVNWNPD